VTNPNEPEQVSPGTIEVIYNHVYFYSEIYSEKCPAFIKAVLDADKNITEHHVTYQVGQGRDPLVLYVQSPGGDIFSSLSLSDWIVDYAQKRKIHSVVSGVCASGATLLSIVCPKRYMFRNSFMMIHQMSSEMWGTYEESKSQMKFMDMAMDSMVKIYTRHSKMTEEEVKEMLKTDTWFNAEQCLELGLIDEILS